MIDDQLMLADIMHMPDIGVDSAENALNNGMMGSQVYSDLPSSQRALSPEDIMPVPVDNSLSADVASLEQQLAQPHGLQISHVQQPGGRLSCEISLSSDTAQNTCLPNVQGPERKSGDESVNDNAARTDEAMDDILRFFLKVLRLLDTNMLAR